MDAPALSARLAVRERPQNRRPVMYQKWRDLLFLHWEYKAQEIQKTLPPGLHVDTFNGRAYLGVVPFFMKDVRPRFFPSVPGISNFMEVNVRTYVYNEQGVAGVWFYSLDAHQWLAVKIARTFFKLPYFYAEMKSSQDSPGGPVIYESWRRGTARALSSRFCYRGRGIPRRAEPGTLEFFLVERYIFFAYDHRQRRLLAGRVYHAPYSILEAEVTAWDDHLFELDGLKKSGRSPDHALMSPGVDVDAFALEAVP